MEKHRFSGKNKEEAIQIANIDDPIVYRTGPWWDHEDIIYN